MNIDCQMPTHTQFNILLVGSGSYYVIYLKYKMDTFPRRSMFLYLRHYYKILRLMFFVVLLLWCPCNTSAWLPGVASWVDKIAEWNSSLYEVTNNRETYNYSIKTFLWSRNFKSTYYSRSLEIIHIFLSFSVVKATN